jgi:type 2 lantibiotic biosynthesis protein LanM
MTLRREERIDLLERSSTLRERRGPDFVPGDPAGDVERITHRLERWRHSVADGDASSFERSLSWDGLEVETARRLLAVPRWTGQAFPTWTDVLAATLEENGSDTGAHTAGPQGFYGRFVVVARERLRNRLPVSAFADVEPAVLETLEAALVRWLTFVCGPALELEKTIFRMKVDAARPPGLAVSDQAFAAIFDEAMDGDGRRRFLMEYAVLARQTCALVLRWCDVMGEFLARLATDRADLTREVAGADDLGRLVEVETGLSDPHHGGRSVLAARFASGHRIIYKPRGVSMDRAYFGLLRWLRAQGSPVAFREPKYLDRGSYAWVEHVPHVPCRTLDEVRTFAHAAGALLCVAYLLDATDLHDGNLIACGTDPVLIDLETLLEPQVRRDTDRHRGAAAVRADVLLNQSVVRTALLPTWRFRPGSDVADVGGLGTLCGSTSTGWYRRTTESNPLSDELRSLALTTMPDGTGGARALADQVERGFRETYVLVRERRDALLAQGGPFAAFAAVPVRLLFRDTQVYVKLAESSFAPNACRDGADRSLALERIKRVLHRAARRPAFTPLLRAEARAIEELDIPFFSTTTTSADLDTGDGEVVSDFFVRPSFDAVRDRIQGLNDRDLDRQLECTHMAFDARLAAAPHSEDSSPPARREPGTRTLEREALIQAARRIADDLAERAIRGDDGTVTWLTLTPVRDAPVFQPGPAPPDILSGTAGIALFFGTLFRQTGLSEYADHAAAALRPLELSLADERSCRELAAEIGIGGATGIGALIYALARSTELLDSPGLLPTAVRLAETITITGDDTPLGIFEGLAGASLGLLALHTVRPDGRALEQAADLGRRLVGSLGRLAALPPERVRGLADGAAGVAYTLGRLHAATGLPELQSAAEEVWRRLAAEQTESTTPSSLARCCRDRPGITLARLAAGVAGDDGLVAAGLDAAAHAPLGLDTLCCGSFGRVEVLLTASRYLGRPEMHAAAADLAAECLARAGDGLRLRLYPGLPAGTWAPGLFMGTAGIGYELLRLADSQGVPSVLRWE